VESNKKKAPQAQNILDVIPYGILQVDTAGRILYANSAYHRYWDAADGSLIGASVFDRASSEDDRRFLQGFLDRAAKNRPSENPLYIKRIRKNGALIEFRVDWGYDYDDNGKVTTINCVVTDVTSHMKAERALQESRALLDSYFATAPVGMALLDAEMRFVKLNNTIAKVNGLTVEDHLQKLPSELLPEPLASEVEETLASVLRTGKPIMNQEISGETANRRWYWCDAD